MLNQSLILNMSNKVAFFEEFIALCRKHGFCIVSDDPYECIDVAPLDSDLDGANLDVLEYLQNHEC